MPRLVLTNKTEANLIQFTENHIFHTEFLAAHTISTTFQRDFYSNKMKRARTDDKEKLFIIESTTPIDLKHQYQEGTATGLTVILRAFLTSVS